MLIQIRNSLPNVDVNAIQAVQTRARGLSGPSGERDVSGNLGCLAELVEHSNGIPVEDEFPDSSRVDVSLAVERSVALGEGTEVADRRAEFFFDLAHDGFSFRGMSCWRFRL